MLLSDRRYVIAGVGALLVGLALVARIRVDRAIASDAALLAFGGGAEPFPESPRLVASIRADGLRIAPLHTRKPAPRAGDWLDLHAETQQSFDGYRGGGAAVRPRSGRNTLYIQPWGKFDDEQGRVVTLTAEGMSRFFGVPVRFLPAVSLESLPDSPRPPHPRRGDRRLLTSFVLSELGGSRPTDGFAIVAMTPVDLTRTGGGTWAFGQASLFEGVAVCSLFRHGDPHEEFTTCLRRSLKTALHETGHILGISHCVNYECAMNGSNSREEADSRPMWFCPEDEQKVWLACGIDRTGRYERLAGFAQAQGLEEEGRFWQRSSRALKMQLQPLPRPR